MMTVYLPESEIQKKLAEQSQEAIKILIKTADVSRKNNKTKDTNFLNSFFKEAKKHIA